MIIDQSRRLFRGQTIGRLALATFAMAAGALLAPPLAETWRSPSRVDVVLAAEGAIVDEPVFAALSKHAHSPPFLDGLVAEQRLQFSNERSVDKTTTIGIIKDLILGSETTVADREEALRAQLAASITLASSAKGQTLTLSATADDAVTASRVANAAARRLSSDAGALDLSRHDPDTEQLRHAAEEAENAFTEFTTELGPQKLAALRLAEGETRALSDEIASADRRLAEITRRLEHVSSMTVPDVLARPLPDSLDFTALDYHRQRHVEAKLQMDQLSNQLGPRHPRLLSASGAVDAPAKDIQPALTKLSAELQRQQEAASAQLAAQRNRLTERVTETGEQVERLKVLEGEAETSREAYDLALRADAGSDTRRLLLIPLNKVPGPATSESLPNVAVVGLGAAGGLMGALTVSLWSARRRGRS
jgi:succinoglycan biosynthesis transport protein ExoP